MPVTISSEGTSLTIPKSIAQTMALALINGNAWCVTNGTWVSESIYCIHCESFMENHIWNPPEPSQLIHKGECPVAYAHQIKHTMENRNGEFGS